MSEFAPVNPTPIRNPGKITVGMFPGDDHPVVLEVASTLGSSTAFSPVGSFTRVALQDGGFRHTMPYPIDGIRRHFRGRHEKVGWTAGEYTRTVSAIPRPVEHIDASTSGGWEWKEGELGGPAPLSEAVMKGAGHLSADVSIDVGTPNVDSTSIEKVLVVLPTEYTQQFSSQSWIQDPGGKHVAPASTELTRFVAPVTLPPGVTVIGMRGQFNRTGSADTIIVEYNKSSGSTVTESNIHQFDMSSTTASTEFGGWYEVESSVMSETILEDHIYSMSARCVMSSAATSRTIVGRIKLTYAMSQYKDAY